MTPIRGGCYCGTVRFEITKALRVVFNCHCRACRRAHGAPYYPAAYISQDNFRVSAGADSVAAYEVGPEYTRNFCKVCGGRLFNKFNIDDHRLMNVPLSTLDEEPPPELIQGHVNVESKAPWHVIDDRLPQYDQWPPGFRQTLVETLR